MIFRTIWLTIQHEARLLARDPIVLGMLLLAPVVIIVVAGYSLGNLYGPGSAVVRIPLIDHDHGQVAVSLKAALRRERSIEFEPVDSVEHAMRMVSSDDRVAMALEIPATVSSDLSEGREAHLIVYVDPLKRLEVNAIELRLDHLCQLANLRLHAQAQQRLVSLHSQLTTKLEQFSAEVAAQRKEAQRNVEVVEAETRAAVQRQMEASRRQLQESVTASARAYQEEARAALARQLASRQQVVNEVKVYLDELIRSQQNFEVWLKLLKEKAGTHAVDIPQPPSFPTPPPSGDLAELMAPIKLPTPNGDSFVLDRPQISLKLTTPAIPDLRPLTAEIQALAGSGVPNFPGQLGILERPAIKGALPVVNAFDQYVPGFGVTFLMIGMLLGVSLTLFDERDWGTLGRLLVGGVPLSGILIGKIVARSIVGTFQMVILFAIGWALFDVSLGRQPAALLLPSVGISFASAAFGLAVTPLARSHDGVMPLGTVSAMTMAAVGGCWWPVDFEPGWMRVMARWVPTTWTMRSYNALMIYNLPTSSVLAPTAFTIGLGAVFFTAGLLGMLALQRRSK